MFCDLKTKWVPNVLWWPKGNRSFRWNIHSTSRAFKWTRPLGDGWENAVLALYQLLLEKGSSLSSASETPSLHLLPLGPHERQTGNTSTPATTVTEIITWTYRLSSLWHFNLVTIHHFLSLFFLIPPPLNTQTSYGEMGDPLFHFSISLMKINFNYCGDFKYVHKCFDMSPFKR